MIWVKLIARWIVFFVVLWCFILFVLLFVYMNDREIGGISPAPFSVQEVVDEPT